MSISVVTGVTEQFPCHTEEEDDTKCFGMKYLGCLSTNLQSLRGKHRFVFQLKCIWLLGMLWHRNLLNSCAVAGILDFVHYVHMKRFLVQFILFHFTCIWRIFLSVQTVTEESCCVTLVDVSNQYLPWWWWYCL